MASAAALQFFAAAPRPPLNRFVECFWATRGSGPYRRALVLPNGALQLMLNFGAPHHVTAFGARSVDRSYSRFWVAGLQDEPLAIAGPESTDVFAVRFRPGGARAFLGLPLHALTNEVVEADDVLASAAVALHEQVAAAPDRALQVAAAEAWLMERFAPREPDAAVVERAVAALGSAAPGVSVSETCERLGLTNRHLIDLFRRHVGLTPKTFARVRRFHVALGALARGEPRAELAAQLGYADQAHFANEFRRFGALTPGEFVARRGLDDESVILG